MKTLAAIALLLLAFAAQAANSPAYTLQVKNPERALGHFVGDVLTRTIRLDVDPAYQLAVGSLPVKGISRHGLELREAAVAPILYRGRVRYIIRLSYQVFGNGAGVKKAALPQETLKFTSKGKSFTVIVPAWDFSISPLAARGNHAIEQEMSPYRGPMLVDSGFKQPMLTGFVALAVLSLLGLIYINAHAGWLPGMGGPFAQSYRRLRRMSESQAGLKEGVASLHRAFNQTYSGNLFAPDIEDFLRQHPQFSAMRQDIEEFFRVSNAILFGSGPHPAQALAVLRSFARRFRDSERGLT